MMNKLPSRAGRPMLALVLTCAGLAGCQSKDPVAVGQQLGNRMCEQGDELQALKARADAQLLGELKAGTIKTHAQYQERFRALNRAVFRKDSLNATVVEATLAQLKTGFASPADAAVAARQVVRIVNRCDSLDKLEARRHPRPGLRQYMARLTGPDPSALPGSPPPPPPLEEMTIDSATAGQMNLSPRP